MVNIAGRLYISTIADDAARLARDYGFGLEIAEFCTAFNMDTGVESWDRQVRGEMQGLHRFIFHAPFNELCPASIDPMIVEVTRKRYAKAFALMSGYGIDTMVAHSGFVPPLHDEGWFVEKSVLFWNDFLSDKPDGFKLYLENVLEGTPWMLREIACAIGDGRFGLCLDVGHAAIRGGGNPVAEWVDQMLPHLGHVHLHNNDGSQDTHNGPGDGAADVAAVIRRVTEAAPDATFTIETIAGKTSVEWIKSKGFL